MFVNPTAGEVLQKADGIRVHRGILEALDTKANQTLKTLISGSAAAANGNSSHSGGGISVPRLRSGHPLHVVVMPLRGTDLKPEHHACATVFLYDESTERVVQGTILSQLFGLTGAEAALVTRLVQGEELKDAAEQLGITYETARSYMKQIFLKTDTSRQSELVGLIARLSG